ncbi:MAG: glycosyltransferase, partial [Vulcanimicrobiaceae bacterium]
MSLAGLKLAILGSISHPTPPPGYGPWEQIAYNIAEGMLAQGIDVTLFATGNSRTNAKLVSTIPVGLNEDSALNGEVYTALHIVSLFERASEFDLIHNNFDWKPLMYARATTSPPMLTTIHGFSSPPILGAYYAGANRSFFCSISDSDRDPGLAYLGTAYNGIDPGEFTFVDQPGGYLVFLGRWH